MLTYQLQQRVYKFQNDVKPKFPNNVEVEIVLDPADQFGVIENPERLSKTAIVGHKASLLFNANTGKTGVVPSSALLKIEAEIEQNGLHLQIQGNKIIAKKRCENFQCLNELLVHLHYLLPILLNLELGEPPVVRLTSGKIGESIFSWQLGQGLMFFDVTSNEKQREKIIQSFDRLKLISGNKNRRLASALYHYYVAKRLIESGNSPYEYLSEVILNLCKILQSLFGNSRDDVRLELIKLEYSEEEIEETFIPIMILRNEFDVGHIFLKTFNENQLSSMYSYLDLIMKDIKDMLKKVIIKISVNEYTLIEDPILSLDKDASTIITKLISNWASYVKKRSPQVP